MKAYIAIKYHEDHSNREQIEMISAALEKQGFETICITRDLEKWGQVQFDPARLMQKTFDQIEASELVVVDLTEKGVGLGIEAGYAAAKNIPLVTIARKDSDISTTLAGISDQVFLYSQFDELTRFFGQIVKS